MGITDVFSLSQKDWDEIEDQYEAIAKLPAEEMLLETIKGLSKPAQKALALGIMIGRSSAKGGV